MLNYLWGFMIVIGIVVGIVTGRVSEVSSATINSSKEAIALCITMLGFMSLWTGIMNVARSAGIIAALTKGLKPILRLLFPDIPKDHVVNEYIASNMIANIIGLGWAATPMGLKAMKELKTLNNDSERASVDMCTFLIINISSLQLIPVNIIAYRSQYGSVNPTEILAAAIIATLISTAVGVAFSIIARKGCKK
jgi:spore maturation protein A